MHLWFSSFAKLADAMIWPLFHSQLPLLRTMLSKSLSAGESKWHPQPGEKLIMMSEYAQDLFIQLHVWDCRNSAFHLRYISAIPTYSFSEPHCAAPSFDLAKSISGFVIACVALSSPAVVITEGVPAYRPPVSVICADGEHFDAIH